MNEESPCDLVPREGTSTLVPAAFGDQPKNFNAFATIESDGSDQRAGVLPLAATNEN